MTYLIMNASFNEVGLRGSHHVGFINPNELLICHKIIEDLKIWITRYAKAHNSEFANYLIIDELDREGIDIAQRIKNELFDVKVEYCSDTLMINMF